MTTTSPYRLAVIDLDDTLLGPDKRVSPANLDALRRLKENAIEVVIASGRHHSNIAKLASTFDFQGWIISSQGARVEHSQTHEVIYQHLVPPDLAIGLYDRGHREGVTLLGYHPSGVYIENDTEWTRLYTLRAGHIPQVTDLRALAATGLEKLLWSGPAERIDQLHPLLEAEYQDRLYIVETEHEILEFCSSQATKAHGAAVLAEKLGIPREAVLAFGDGNNDVPLLQWAGQSVAMNHGRASAKQAAGLVTPPGPHENAFAEGVALALDPHK